MMAELRGTNGNDTLIGTDSDEDEIFGLGGNDIINGGFGDDYINAGMGKDKTIGGFQNDHIKGEEGNDVISGNSGDDNLDGGDGTDAISGGSGSDVILVAATSSDIVDGGTGLDVISIDYSKFQSAINVVFQDWNLEQTLAGGIRVVNVERLVVQGSGFADTIAGGRYRDSLSGGSGADFISGDRGDDFLDGGSGNDRLDGGDGNDQLYGGDGNDVLIGGNGNDLLFGQDGNDQLYGGAGNDEIHAGDGTAKVDGGSGDDTVVVPQKDDSSIGDDKYQIIGGVGIDRLILSDVAKEFIAKAPSEIITLSNGSTVTGFENYSLYFAARDGATKIVTGAGDDHVTTGTGNDWIDAGSGNDVISSASGDDRIYAGAGNDTVYAGEGANRVYGQAGNDFVSLQLYSGALADGGTGEDTAELSRTYGNIAGVTFSVSGTKATLSDGTILTNFERYNVSFGSGNDVVDSVGSALGVNFAGLGGDDILLGTAGADKLDGGSGSDVLTGGDGDDVILDILGKTNVIRSGDGADTVEIENWDDRHASSTTVDLGAGDDTFTLWGNGRFGKLNVQGGAGIDKVSIDLESFSSGITFELSSYVSLFDSRILIKGVEQVSLDGGNGNDIFRGGDYADIFEGRGGNDTLDGQGGNDIIAGQGGSDAIYGGAGNDILYQDDFDNFVDGLPDDRDKLFGGSGDDIVYMDIGDRASGDAGVDRVVLSRAPWETDDVTFVFSTDLVNVNSTTAFSKFESIEYNGGGGRDTITGGARSDELDGGSGNDLLKGGGGNDTLRGGSGNDKLYGQAGDDLFLHSRSATDFYDGGTGTDSLSFAFLSSGSSAALDLTDQSRNKGAALGLTVAGIENVGGSAQDDDIRGDGAANVFLGGGADDILQGRAGDDTLNGQQGDDVLTGGTGKDKFVFDLDGRDGKGDIITDFTRGQDKLTIDRTAYGISTNDSAVTLVVGSDPAATTGKSTFLFESDNGRLWFDADGKGGSANLELVAILQNVKTLSAGDFSLL